MSSIRKPPVTHPSARTNALGLKLREYEGRMSTLCAGCGHDSVTAAIVQAAWELAIPPQMAAKMSGIGCSAKTTTYFMNQSFGFNSVHGRMPSVTTGAAAANRELICIGVSGDGDSLSIGLGQLCHAIRRDVNMLYIIDNNGVYGLTKGQFSASSDIGSKSKKGEVNTAPPIDPVLLALTLGATFVARSFSGDKQQLVPILKAGIAHRGLALVDVISPCVTFNDHEGSTKSYAYTRTHDVEAVTTDFVPLQREITIPETDAAVIEVPMHDGSVVRLRPTTPGYNPNDRASAYAHVRACETRGEVATGLLFVEESQEEMCDALRLPEAPLVSLPYEALCPGADALDRLMERFR
jgi:2-oxoglutarate ferredoxin oxidoreductase subunit beta